MRIEGKKMVKPLAEIEIGECFAYDEGFFIKTDERTDDGRSVCVNIKYGMLYRLDEEYMVTSVNVKAVIE